MGILNVTPDSFSDGGSYSDVEDAVQRAREMVAQGAWIVDVGGESTRPGAASVTVAEEILRVEPVIAALATEGIRVSVDTRRPEVARVGVSAGASMINDVSASLWNVAAELDVGWIAMHMAGDPTTMQQRPSYRDVVAEVRDFLVDRAAKASAAGVDDVWIDPGFGFGKTTAHNVALTANLSVLVETGIPVMLGASRKASLGEITARSDQRVGGSQDSTPPNDRLEAGLTAAVWAMESGVQMIRTHDVVAHVHAATVVAGNFQQGAA